MPNSLVKFVNRTNGNGRGRLFWGRVGEDGYPFRGPTPPSMTDEEFEDRLTKIGDPQNAMFNTGNPTENAKYLEVLDKIVNGWAQMLVREHHYDSDKKAMLVYIEWVEYYMEDAAASPNPSTGMSPHATQSVQQL